jgi:hypothetical protein
VQSGNARFGRAAVFRRLPDRHLDTRAGLTRDSWPRWSWCVQTGRRDGARLFRDHAALAGLWGAAGRSAWPPLPDRGAILRPRRAAPGDTLALAGSQPVPDRAWSLSDGQEQP